MTGSRSDTQSAGRKPRLGEIATPGRVCPPHNETYDCRLRPNGIGCLRRGGGSGAGRLPDRPDRSRYSGPIRHPNDPQRSVSDESPRRATIPATRRKTREKKQDEFPGHCIIRPETYHAPGRQNRKCGRGESGASASPARPCGARKRGRLVRPVSGQHGSVLPSRNAGRARNICKPDYTLCYTSHSGRCFRPILSDGWKPSGMEPAGKYLHLAHSVY